MWFSSTSAICREASSRLEAYKESLISARDRYLLLMNGVRKFEPDPRLGCPDHKPVKLFRMHDHPDENRKSIGPNILDNNGIELDEKNPGPVGDWKAKTPSKVCASCRFNVPDSGKRFCTTKGRNIFDVLSTCCAWQSLEVKKPIPTEMFTVTKTGDANTSEHYKHFRIQPIDFVVANDLGFLEANVIKYICRYPYKGSALKDLEKARQYVDWLIERERKRGSV